ncbi:helix-turn-helix transcriptional regulator [Desulfosporosinus burensis]
MDTRKAVANRIVELCKERNITPNALSYRAAVPQSTIKSILNDESLNPGIVTIKKLCDGLEISLSDFFNTDVFSNLEQELT